MAKRVGERNVPDTPSNAYLNTAVKAKELSLHTIRNCSNKNIFNPEYQEALTNKIISTSVEIFLNIQRANKIRVKNEKTGIIIPERREARKEFQGKAAQQLSELEDLLSIAKALFHLRGKKVKYWKNMIFETQNLLKHWRESDRKRFE